MSNSVVYSPEEKKRVDKIVTDNYKLFLFLVNLVTKGRVTPDDEMFSDLFCDFWRICAYWDPAKGTLSTIAKFQLRRRYFSRKKRAWTKEEHTIKCQSFDAEIGEEGTLYDLCADVRYGDRQTVDSAMIGIIKDALRTKIKLSPRQQKTMDLFFKGYSFYAIAKIQGMSDYSIAEQYNSTVEKLQYVIGKNISVDKNRMKEERWVCKSGKDMPVPARFIKGVLWYFTEKKNGGIDRKPFKRGTVFNTWEEAKAFMVDEAEEEVQHATENVAYAEARLKRIKELKQGV
jgi:hypothetical protein